MLAKMIRFNWCKAMKSSGLLLVHSARRHYRHKKGIAVGLNDVLCALHIVSACEQVVNEVKKEVSTCALIKENDPIVHQWLWCNDITR